MLRASRAKARQNLNELRKVEREMSLKEEEDVMVKQEEEEKEEEERVGGERECERVWWRVSEGVWNSCN